MRILVGDTDITQALAEYDGEYVCLELSEKHGSKRICWGGVVKVIPDEQPYNPLADMDCGTDAMMGRKI